MARALHADACRDHALAAWVVLWDLPAYPERYAARLATSTALPYLLLAETLGRYPGDATAWSGAVRAAVGGSAGGGGGLVYGVQLNMKIAGRQIDRPAESASPRLAR